MSTATPAQERHTVDVPLPQAVQALTYRLVSPQELCDLTEQCVRMGESITLDTETTALDPWASKLVTVQIGGVSETPWTCDVRYVGPADLTALAGMVRLLFSGRIELIGHNLKFDVLHLAVALGIQPEELSRLRAYDTLLAEQVILGGRESEQGGRERADLAATAGRYGYVLSKDPRSWFADLNERPEWNEPLPPEQLHYAAQDIAVLEAVRRGQLAEIAAQGLEPTIRLEMACLPAIAAMELRGIRLDVPGWRAYIAKQQEEADQIARRLQVQLYPALRRELAETQLQETQALTHWQDDLDQIITEAKATWEALPKDARPGWGETRRRVDTDFRRERPRPDRPKAVPDALNLGSPIQLKRALELVGVYVPDTAAETLAVHEKQHPAIQDLLAWRERNKRVTAFGESVLARVQPDGRVHPGWRQIGSEASGVATGRMSCSEPNLQQIPREEDGDGDSLRRHIVASPGQVFLVADYSQIEPRILAERSRDRALLEVFASGQDLYTQMAIRLSLAPRDTTKNEAKQMRLGSGAMRDAMKTLTLAVMYGYGPRSLAKDLGCSEDEAQAHLNRFFTAFPGVADYRRKTALEALRVGYSCTLGGRRRNFLLAPPPERRQFVTREGFLAALQQYRIAESRAQRQAVNATIQGTGADIMKLAIVLVSRRLPQRASLVASVHDELIVEANEAVADEAADVLVRAMTEAARAYLPTVSLGDLHAVQASHWRKE